MQFFSKVFSANTSSSYTLNTACFNVEVSPMDTNSYKSTVDVAELGTLTLGLVHNRSSVVIRKEEEFDDTHGKRFTIMYAVDGELMISNDHGTLLLKKGEFVLLDNSCFRKMFVYKSVTLLLICVSRSVLQKYIPSPEDILAHIIQETNNADEQPLFSPLLSLWNHLKSGELEEFSTTIGEELLRDISQAYSRYNSTHKKSRHSLRLMNRVKQHIESNLRNTDLSAESIAAEFKISSRHLRSLFQGGEKLSHYIQRRRIEESAKMLINPQYRSSSITEISYQCGFNSSTHFSRCFRSVFKETARDFRNRHLNMVERKVKAEK